MDGITGAGIGLRSSFLKEVIEAGFSPDWFEVTPENWIRMPVFYREAFEKVAASFPLVAHGVSLSLGSPGPLDHEFLSQLKDFLDRYNIRNYSEHLSFSIYNNAQSYELLPVPMTEKMAELVARKIREASEFLERQVILENASWYFMPYAEMEEPDFINMVLEKSGAPLLLDVNNVYVNSVNHGFDAGGFIDRLDLQRTAYVHVAGHTFFPEDRLIIDTHGDSVCSNVFTLLEKTLTKLSPDVPVMIERDNNIPPLEEIRKEYSVLKNILEKRKEGVLKS